MLVRIEQQLASDAIAQRAMSFSCERCGLVLSRVLMSTRCADRRDRCVAACRCSSAAGTARPGTISASDIQTIIVSTSWARTGRSGPDEQVAAADVDLFGEGERDRAARTGLVEVTVERDDALDRRPARRTACRPTSSPGRTTPEAIVPGESAELEIGSEHRAGREAGTGRDPGRPRRRRSRGAPSVAHRRTRSCAHRDSTTLSPSSADIGRK